MNIGTLLATILLAVVSVAHLLRVLFGWQVTIADAIVPVWASGIAAAVAGLVAILLWKGARPKD